MSRTTRRELLQHTGALGLGALFLPQAGRVVREQQAASQIPPGVILETIKAGGLSHYSYFLADEKAGVAVVIDPRRDVQPYLDLAQQHGVEIVAALETHVHADFVSGARELAAQSPKTKIAASQEGGTTYGFPIDRLLRDGDEISVGDLVLKAIHTPGHTPEHLSYLALTADKQPWALFTGDFLFVGSVGRPDLMGVQNTGPLAKALYRSVQHAFEKLPDRLTIYPAHGPGSPCGAGIQAPDGDPTLGQERQGNPYWRMNDEAVFTESLLVAQPPVPYYWPRMKQINAAGPRVIGKQLPIEMLKPKAFHDYVQQNDAQLLDTRSMQAYAGGAIPGAINIGYNEVLSLWGGWVLDPERPIAIVKPAQGSFTSPIAWLARTGFLNVAVGLDGDMKSWVNQGLPFDSFATMSVHQVKQTFPTDQMQLLDVRQPAEWDKGHLPGAQYLFLPEIPKRLNELDRQRPIAVYCGNGYRASIATSMLRNAGFQACSVPGSWDAWVAAGYPIVKPKVPGKASVTRRTTA